MTVFIRSVSSSEKTIDLLEKVRRFNQGAADPDIFSVDPEEFKMVPGAPFAYWATSSIRGLFTSLKPFESDGRIARQGLSTADDFRFVRCWWEVQAQSIVSPDERPVDRKLGPARWYPFLKGGGRSAFVAELDLVLNYQSDGRELKAWVSSLYGNSGWSRNIVSTDLYYRRGFSWSLRSNRFSPSAVPDGCIFSASRYQAFTASEDLPWTIALLNSQATTFLLRMCSERFEHPKYVVGIVSRLPFLEPGIEDKRKLTESFYRACSIKIAGLACDETSHHFCMPRLPGMKRDACSEADRELEAILGEIDLVAELVYGFSKSDADLIANTLRSAQENLIVEGLEEGEEESEDHIDQGSFEHVLSWALGVAFGRFDLSMVTGERALPGDFDPFAPLSTKSPGMLPDGDAPFHTHAGILVNDPGHPHDLPRLMEEVLVRIEAPVPPDVRRWLQREFFPLHLQCYSKSRRKAPIYWPLSTVSGSYTLWVYYPSLTSQTLYTAINDFVEPKLKQVGDDVMALRNKAAARTRDDEKQFEALQAFELELIELRDTLLKLAPTYKPNHDDGVQISAAPLWPLFRQKPWQKVLKDTWAKLEKGDYDWAMLAMNYWPERVREKCKADKSLAIAHGLEHLYVEPEAAPKKTRGRKKAGGTE